eukprot:RCo049065
MSCSCPEHLEHSGPAAEEKDSSDDEGGAPAAPAEPEDEDKVLEVIQADSESVNLCFLRVARMQTFQLHRLTRCTSLSLHRNLLHRLEEFPPALHRLTDLDLSDNKIKRLPPPVLAPLVALTKLDCSYNNIRAIDGVHTLTELRELYLQSNKITSIEGLSTLVNLNLLELGCNRIREICNLQPLTQLQTLFLGKNKIAKIQGLDTLTQLRVLSLQCNRLTTIENLSALTSLTELYLSENGIAEMTDLNPLVNLRLLDLSSNRIEVIRTETIQALRGLQEFWFNDNKVRSWGEVTKLAAFPELRVVYLRHNPIFEDPRYRPKVIDMIPRLEELDSVPVVRTAPA